MIKKGYGICRTFYWCPAGCGKKVSLHSRAKFEKDQWRCSKCLHIYSKVDLKVINNFPPSKEDRR